MISANDVKILREKTGAGMMDCKHALEATSGDMDKAIDWLREKGISKAMKKAERIAAEGLAFIKIEGNEAVIIEVNSETDFVAKNSEFTDMVSEIADVLLKHNVQTLEEALLLPTSNGTINDLIVAKTAKIGEKLSFRRFEKIAKTDADNFGSYLHMGGKIAALTVIEGGNSEVANNVSMQLAAMHPLYLNSSEVPTEDLEKEKEIMRNELLNEGKPADRIENILVGKVKKFYEENCLVNQAYIKAENKETVEEYLNSQNAKALKMIRFEVGEGIEKRCDNFAEEVAKQMQGN